MIVPSATDTPIWGIVTSTSVSVSEELTARLLHAVDAGEDGLFERGRERDRDVRRGDADDRPSRSSNPCSAISAATLGARRARHVRLVDDYDLRAALDA